MGDYHHHDYHHDYHHHYHKRSSPSSHMIVERSAEATMDMDWIIMDMAIDIDITLMVINTVMATIEMGIIGIIMAKGLLNQFLVYLVWAMVTTITIITILIMTITGKLRNIAVIIIAALLLVKKDYLIHNRNKK